MTAEWRAPVNQLLYSLTYSKTIGEPEAEFSASSAVTYGSLTLGPEVYRCAIDQALASGPVLDGMSLLPQFDQAQLVGFLRAVAVRLDEMRPWPEPAVRPLDHRGWSEFTHAVQIAELDGSLVQVMDVVQHGFRPVDSDQSGQQVLMLRLGTGETVALLGTFGIAENVALYADSPDNPAAVITHFSIATGFPAERIRR
jgi:hypothetical protein